MIDQHVYVRARRTDPETSQQAALDFEANQSKAQRSVSTVVAILKVYGELTDFQLRDFWHKYWEGKWSFTLPCKARHWARQAGLVKHVGFGKHQGRRVRKWGLGRDDKFLDSTKENKDKRIAELEAENEVLREQNFAMNKTIADLSPPLMGWD